MYNYIKDKKYFQRNAAIALGNTGLAEHIPVLSQAMNNSEEIVRGYAAWGLGRIGGNGARSALERCLKYFYFVVVPVAVPELFIN